MTILLESDEEDLSTKTNDRRKNRFRFDRSINIGSILSLIIILISGFTAYKGVIGYLEHIERSAVKADIMWEHFYREHADLNPDDLRALR